MRKLLRSQDILLLGLANAFDFFDFVVKSGGLLEKVYESYYGWVPEKYRRVNLSRVVGRNFKTGLIEKIIKGGKIYLRLSSDGKKRINRDFPLSSLSNKWDGKWRIVTFDIKEMNRISRDRLRRKLKELGFGMLQKSVFISPYDFLADLSEFLENYGMADYVFVMEVSRIMVGEVKEMANKVWNLDFLNEQYREIIEKIEKLFANKIHDRVKLLQVKQEYLELLLKDSHLPKELLPEDWLGEKVKKEIAKI